MTPARFPLRPAAAAAALASALLLTLTSAPAAPAAPAPTTARPAAADTRLTAQITRTSVWDSGYGADVSLTNHGDTTADGWTIEFDLPAGTTVSSHWSATKTRQGQHYRFSNVSYNATVAPGARQSFGFNTAGTGLPLNCTVDGLPCDGGGTTPTDPPTEPPAAGTPVAVNGQLEVCGTKLCNEHGNPVQLRGMSTHGTQWYPQCLTGGSLDALAHDWNADILRVSTYVQEGGYETDPAHFTDLADSLIRQASDRGMYVIVDWHMLDPGDPHLNLDNARRFFTEIANRNKGRDNILYEIANEPSAVSWSRIKSYAEQIIPVIRAVDSDAPVLVGTRAWSSLGVSEGADESEVVNNPVDASNIMYTFHFYAASHRDEYLAALTRAADRIPLFVTEFGTQDYAGEGADDFAMSQRYLDLMASKKISWTNWNFSDDQRSGAVFDTGTCQDNGPWTGTSSLKPAGAWIRDRIRTPDSFPTD
ncbi:cellulase family glycosylhydrolase [Streptomyces griseoloalbus]|uniref:Endoglucanase n=1 Tax=Streptomyces griseoloalbus TaxID=67303 RepID=A0A7W8BMF2_9ACTN|nr:cellulase family glycosylhydrolase [Streptomyces albaduncus]MBB5126081.1 endoglucanase [Streptomyces albaduncus]GGW77007.1 endoglucanase [Streptomyces albaduncus]